MNVVILRVAIPVNLHQNFDYLLPANYELTTSLFKGIRIKVPFGRRQVIGFLMSVEKHSEIPYSQLKEITEILDDKPLLSFSLISLLEWISRYYHVPVGQVFSMALPTSLRRIKSTKPRKIKLTNKTRIQNTSSLSDENIHILNTEQKFAFECINQSLDKFQVFLLEGVTGSGKTEVYFHLIQKMLDKNKQILLLVPEISLTPQMFSRLHARFKENIVLLHSKLSENKRLQNWQLARSGEAKIVVGTRSAVFTPLLSPGLIILDEEHDSSFKQSSSVRYHARDTAIMRASLEKIPIVLGSATPSLESLWNAEQGRYQKLNLLQRAGKATLPAVRIMDIRNHRLIGGLSEELLKQINQHLQRKEQVLLFLNRRGFAPLYLCHGCGWTAMCRNCDSPLRLHQKPKKLRCHYCDYMQSVPQICQNCHKDQLFDVGQGTQKLEEVLKKYFPTVHQIRIDADSTRGKDRLSGLLESIQPKESAILIGTQMLAKGHHFPGVTLAVIVDGDMGLFGVDFRALEQSSQLIVQVAGRSGRADKQGIVIIQTHYPNHPLLKKLIEEGYPGFTKLALKERRRTGWPPFTHLALLHAKARTQQKALNFLEVIKKQWCISYPGLTVLGPVPSLLAKRAGYYQAQLLFQAEQRPVLHKALAYLLQNIEDHPQASVKYTLDVDPIEIY